MRKSRRPLDALLPRTRQRLLSAVLMQPERWWYLSDLAKRLGVMPSSLQRELSALSEAGILRRKREGNRVYFQTDPECPFMGELTGLIAKTAGLVDVLRDALRRLERSIRVAFVYGSLARAEERSASDIDLFVVGRLTLTGLGPALRRAEERLGRAVNVSLFTADELSRKARAGSHFVRDVLGKEKLFVLGTARDLEQALRR